MKMLFKEVVQEAIMRGNRGQLSRDDIIREINAGNLVVEPQNGRPEDNPNIKAASFDITPSCLIMSVKTGSFMRIYSTISQCKKGHRNPEKHCDSCDENAKGACVEQRYVYIQPRDTALVLSREYIQLPANMCGNVFSRVSTVSSGLGHISTTIDPLWRGALLIAISNPSSEPIKLTIQDKTQSSIPLATVTLQYLHTPVDSQTVHSIHLPARVDILEKYLYDISETQKRIKLSKNFLRRFWNMEDYNLTVRLIDRLKKMKDIQPTEWKEKLEELENEVYAQKIQENTWKTILKEIGPLVRKALMIGVLIVLATTIYQIQTGEFSDLASFSSALIVVVVQCLITVILSI